MCAVIDKYKNPTSDLQSLLQIEHSALVEASRPSIFTYLTPDLRIHSQVLKL